MQIPLHETQISTQLNLSVLKLEWPISPLKSPLN